MDFVHPRRRQSGASYSGNKRSTISLNNLPVRRTKDCIYARAGFILLSAAISHSVDESASSSISNSSHSDIVFNMN